MWYERYESRTSGFPYELLPFADRDRRRRGLHAVLDVDTHLEGFELPKGERLDRYNLTLDNWEPDTAFDPDEEEEEEDGDLVVVGREPPESQKRSCQYPPASLAADMARASIRDEDKDIDDEGESSVVGASENRRQSSFPCVGRPDASVDDVVRDGAEQAGGGVRALRRKQWVSNLGARARVLTVIDRR